MYTREAVLGMIEGLQLDKAVHEIVMGFDLNGFHWPRTGSYGNRHEMFKEEPSRVTWVEFPKYSTDIAAAWEVVEKFNEITVKRFETMKGHRYVCRIELTYDGEPVIAQGETAPEAICKAALLSLLKED